MPTRKPPIRVVGAGHRNSMNDRIPALAAMPSNQAAPDRRAKCAGVTLGGASAPAGPIGDHRT